LLFAGPTAAHALARAARVRGLAPLLARDDDEGKLPSKP
jgi:multisubunit Na+/H+ antiporter MnhG subunit